MLLLINKGLFFEPLSLSESVHHRLFLTSLFVLKHHSHDQQASHCVYGCMNDSSLCSCVCKGLHVASTLPFCSKRHQHEVDRVQDAMKMSQKRKTDIQAMRTAAQNRDAPGLRRAIEVAMTDYVIEKYVKPHNQFTPAYIVTF